LGRGENKSMPKREIGGRKGLARSSMSAVWKRRQELKRGDECEERLTAAHPDSERR